METIGLAILAALIVLGIQPLKGGATMPTKPRSGVRGIRNHNPFNLRPGSPWRGLADPSVDEGNYLVFKDAASGLRAGFINLRNQQIRHDLRTIRGIITKYAPEADNNNTTAYINAVARSLGVGPDTVLDLVNDPETLLDFGVAVIFHENGQQPYSHDELAAGVRAAGGAL